MQLPERAVLVLATAALLAGTAIAQKKNEFRFVVTPGASISVVNEYGPVTVRPATSRQVIVIATPHSQKVEVDTAKNGNRIDVHSRVVQRANADEMRVDYLIEVPTDSMVSIHSANGPIKVDGLNNGDLISDCEGGEVQVRNETGGHVHVRTVNGSVILANLKNTSVEVMSVGGDVNMNAVSGPRVNVSTTKGRVQYVGDFGGDGEYSMSSHSGDIDVTMPADASVDMTARSVIGGVDDGFRLQPPAHPSFAVAQGRSFAGTANSGRSSVQLNTFSGKIQVKKQ